MNLIETIRQIAEGACPGYGFQYETQKMMNVDADYQRFPCIFFDEYYTETEDLVARYGDATTASIELHFLRLSEFQDDAINRAKVRELIKGEALKPFIKAVKDSGMFKRVRVLSYSPEPPLFDANAVGIMLRIELTYPDCL